MTDNDFHLKLSPNVRLRMTIQREMDLDPENELFNEALHQKYIQMHGRALDKQEATMKSVILTDALLALVLSGKSLTIPGTSLEISDIPAAVEVLTVLASLSFMSLCLAFINTQAYLAIAQEFTNRIAQKKFVDPDFLSAAHMPTELYEKIFRLKMNIVGSDFFEAGRGFGLFYPTAMKLMLVSFLSLIVLHMSLVGWGIWAIWELNLLAIVVCIASVVANAVGLLVSLDLPFNFSLPKTDCPPSRPGPINPS